MCPLEDIQICCKNHPVSKNSLLTAFLVLFQSTFHYTIAKPQAQELLRIAILFDDCLRRLPVYLRVAFNQQINIQGAPFYRHWTLATQLTVTIFLFGFICLDVSQLFEVFRTCPHALQYVANSNGTWETSQLKGKSRIVTCAVPYSSVNFRVCSCL